MLLRLLAVSKNASGSNRSIPQATSIITQPGNRADAALVNHPKIPESRLSVRLKSYPQASKVILMILKVKMIELRTQLRNRRSSFTSPATSPVRLMRLIKIPAQGLGSIGFYPNPRPLNQTPNTTPVNVKPQPEWGLPKLRDSGKKMVRNLKS